MQNDRQDSDPVSEPDILPAETIEDSSQKRYRVFKRAAVALILLVVLTGVGLAFYRTRNHQAIERFKAEARTQNEPWTRADLASRYSAVPPALNGATVLLSAWQTDHPERWQSYLEGKPVNVDPNAEVIDPDLPWAGRRQKPVPRIGPLSEEMRIALEEVVNATAARRTAIHATLERPELHFSLPPGNRGTNTPLHLIELRWDFQLLRWEALAALDAKDFSTGLRSLMAMRALSDRLAKDPYPTSQAVRVAGYSMLLDIAELALSRGTLDGAQRQALRTLILGIDLPSLLRETLLRERADSLVEYASLDQSLAARSGTKLTTLKLQLLGLLGLREADERLAIGALRQAIRATTDPTANYERRLAQGLSSANAAANRVPPRPIAAAKTARWGSMADRINVVTARRRALLAALAIEDYRAQHAGNLPTDLKAITPKANADWLKDPFVSGPLQYKLRPRGYVIYSVGPDRIDHGGKERPPRGAYQDYDVTVIVEK